MIIVFSLSSLISAFQLNEIGFLPDLRTNTVIFLSKGLDEWNQKVNLQSKASDGVLGFSVSGMLLPCFVEVNDAGDCASFFGDPKIPDPRIDVFGLKIEVFNFEGEGEAVGDWFIEGPPSVSAKME